MKANLDNAKKLEEKKNRLLEMKGNEAPRCPDPGPGPRQPRRRSQQTALTPTLSLTLIDGLVSTWWSG